MNNYIKVLLFLWVGNFIGFLLVCDITDWGTLVGAMFVLSPAIAWCINRIKEN